MNFVFENRWYSKPEILKQFSIAEKTWKNWLYDEKGKKKKDLASLFTPGKTLSSLTEKEKNVVNQLLRMTLGKD